jgi:phytoene synthase
MTAPAEPGGLRDGLPVLQRMALSWAPAAARVPTLALLALDTRLAGIVRNSREPMLAQLRLAWWREQFGRDPAGWPEGEPLLVVLRSWQGRHGGLAALVDGWELLTGTAPLPPSALAGFAQARGAAFAGLAEAVGAAGDAAAARRLGTGWALADLGANLSHPDERGAARELAQAHDWRHARLSRAMRPLAVLHGLAARAVRRGEQGADGASLAIVAALRLGLLGR